MTESPLMLRTKNVYIVPMNIDSLERKVVLCEDPYEKERLGEMLKKCESDPQNALWYVPWNLFLRSVPDQSIGTFYFFGPQKKGRISFYFEVDHEYQGVGYGSEIARKMVDWALNQPDVYFIDATAEYDNYRARRILQKTGFVKEGMEEEGTHFVFSTPSISYSSVYVLIGLAIGMAISLYIGGMMLGLAIGLAIGMCFGIYLDIIDVRHRRKIIGDDKKDKSE